MLAEGFKVVFGTPIIRDIMVCTAILNFGGGVNLGMWLQYAYRLLHITPRVSSRFGVGKTPLISVALSIISAALIPVAALGSAVIFLGLSTFLADVYLALYNITQISLRQRLIPVRLQGRLNATLRTITSGMLPLGSFLGGLAAERLGIYPVMFTGIACGIGATFFVLRSSILSYGMLDGDEKSLTT